jgi:hypothetical protein
MLIFLIISCNSSEADQIAGQFCTCIEPTILLKEEIKNAETLNDPAEIEALEIKGEEINAAFYACSGEVLEIVREKGAKFEKEVDEAMDRICPDIAKLIDEGQ